MLYVMFFHFYLNKPTIASCEFDVKHGYLFYLLYVCLGEVKNIALLLEQMSLDVLGERMWRSI